MAQRLRLYDLRNSRLPGLLGLCTTDQSAVADALNAAQERLLHDPASGDEGWWGTWAEVQFCLHRDHPYVTLPREIARLEKVSINNSPIELNNQFVEYLDFGNGRMPKRWPGRALDASAFQRNFAPTFLDITGQAQYIRLYPGSDLDVDKRVLVQGVDDTGARVYTLDAGVQIEGEFVTMQAPYSSTTTKFRRLEGIQKDVTTAPVKVYQVDPDTNVEVQISLMQPGEKTGHLARYYFGGLPCCPHHLTVTAIAKLDLVPVVADTDYLLIQSKEALIAECESQRLGSVDNAASKQLSMAKHKDAIRLLVGQLSHYLGKDTPAVSVSCFGSARLERQNIGML